MAQWVCESGQLGPESASLWVRQQQAASDVTRSPVPGGRVWASKCGEVGSRGLISRPRVTLPGPAPPVRRVTSEDRQPWTQAPCQGASGASLSTWVPPGPPAPSLLAFAGERGTPWSLEGWRSGPEDGRGVAAARLQSRLASPTRAKRSLCWPAVCPGRPGLVPPRDPGPASSDLGRSTRGRQLPGLAQGAPAPRRALGPSPPVSQIKNHA